MDASVHFRRSRFIARSGRCSTRNVRIIRGIFKIVHFFQTTYLKFQVTFVGIIRSAERKFNSASIDYYVDDNTGPPLLVNQLIEVVSVVELSHIYLTNFIAILLIGT